MSELAEVDPKTRCCGPLVQICCSAAYLVTKIIWSGLLVRYDDSLRPDNEYMWLTPISPMFF